MTSNISHVGVSQQNVLKPKPLTIPDGMTTDLGILCLWAALGLTMTAVVFALGYGAEVIQALAVSG